MTGAKGDERNRLAPTRKGDGKRVMTAGDAPETVLGLYLIERDRLRGTASFFRDHRETEPRFIDAGRSLRAQNAYPDAVRDMLQIAKHRGWNQVRVNGDPAFKREVWVQARSLGLDVRGHRPSDRDKQAAGFPQHRPKSSELNARIDRAAVVVRALIADPAAQARLMARALARALARATERDREPSRPREEKFRGG